MPNESLKKFAEELREAREFKNITLLQIAGKLKIDLKFLQAIEDANFDILPELYIRAFIKEYAQTIDLNTIEVLQKFDLAKSGQQEQLQQEKSVHQTEAQTKGVYSTKEFNSNLDPSLTLLSEKLNQRAGLQVNYILGGIVLLIALVVFYFAFLNDTSKEIVIDKEEAELNEAKPRYEVEKQLADAPIPNGPDSLRLLIETSDRVWVKVSTDGKIVHQQIVPPKTKLNFAATKTFSVSVGNAGVVKLLFNNKPVENIGKYGEIRNIFITSDTVRYITITPPVKNEKKSTTQN